MEVWNVFARKAVRVTKTRPVLVHPQVDRVEVLGKDLWLCLGLSDEGWSHLVEGYAPGLICLGQRMSIAKEGVQVDEQGVHLFLAMHSVDWENRMLKLA